MGGARHARRSFPVGGTVDFRGRSRPGRFCPDPGASLSYDCDGPLPKLARDRSWRAVRRQELATARRVIISIVSTMSLIDTFGRPLRNLRLSVTDRCNLRCQYCMPEAEYVWLPREDLLHFEEISALVDVFLSLGVDRLRLTGGEPLLRRNLPALVSMLSAKPGINDLAITTNGIAVSEHVDTLMAAGMRRITVSLDTLRRDRFINLTRFDELDRVKEGIEAARSALVNSRGAPPPRAPSVLKLDSVIIKGVNDDELADLIEYGRSVDAEVRFIEYMDVGGATHWSAASVFS